MLNKLICLEEKISWNCIVTAKFMWNQNSKTASQDYWHTCFIRLPRFWATSPQPKQKTPKKSWIAIFQSAKSSIVQFLPINQKTNLHKSTFLFCFLNQCLVALSCRQWIALWDRDLKRSGSKSHFWGLGSELDPKFS